MPYLQNDILKTGKYGTFRGLWWNNSHALVWNGPGDKIFNLFKPFPFSLSFPRAHNKYKCQIISWLVVVAQYVEHMN